MNEQTILTAVTWPAPLTETSTSLPFERPVCNLQVPGSNSTNFPNHKALVRNIAPATKAPMDFRQTSCCGLGGEYGFPVAPLPKTTSTMSSEIPVGQEVPRIAA